MADIELFEFPDAGALSDGDYLHINQTSADYKVTLGNLASKFGGMGIYDLTSITTVSNPYYLPISTTSGIAGNRKVSAQDFMKYTQEKQHYTTTGTIVGADTVVFRPSGSPLLKEATVSTIKGSVLNTTTLTPLTTPDATDLYNIYDVSASEPKRITQNNLKSSIVKKQVISIAYTSNKDATLTNTHTLGVSPDLVNLTARCTVDSGGYVSGETINLNASTAVRHFYIPFPDTDQHGYSTLYDSSSISVVLGESAGVGVMNKTTRDVYFLEANKWVLDATLIAFP